MKATVFHLLCYCRKWSDIARFQVNPTYTLLASTYGMYQNHKCEFGLLMYNSPPSRFITTQLRLAIHNNGTTLTADLHRDCYQVIGKSCMALQKGRSTCILNKLKTMPLHAHLRNRMLVWEVAVNRLGVICGVQSCLSLRCFVILRASLLFSLDGIIEKVLRQNISWNPTLFPM